MHLSIPLASLLASTPALALPLINDPPLNEIASYPIPIDALLLPPPPTTAIAENLLKATPTTSQPTRPRMQGNLCHAPPLARDVDADAAATRLFTTSTGWSFGFAHKNTVVQLPAGLQTRGPGEPRRGIDRWYDSSWIVPTDHPRAQEGDDVDSVREEDEEARLGPWREMMGLGGGGEGGRRG